jgi:hypothetical protein
MAIGLGNNISLLEFINYQKLKEKEIKVDTTLEIMNVTNYASDLSFILIQQPAIVLRALIEPIEMIITNLTKRKLYDAEMILIKFAIELFFNEAIVYLALIITRFVKGDLLVATQVCVLIEYLFVFGLK